MSRGGAHTVLLAGSMLPDYGLEAPDDEQYGEGFNDENDDEDTFNDDTFGDAGEWKQGNEAALEMSRLHEAFLSGELEMPPSERPAEYIPDMDAGDMGLLSADAGGFFGDLGGLGGGGLGDFLLEDEPSFDIPLPNLDDDVPLSLDAHTESLLDSPSKQAPPRAQADPLAAAGAASSNRGLRVSGLPRNLDETQTKQLLTHFGPLAHFQLQRGAASNTALLSYQDASVTDSACASLHGIPLGASTLEVKVVDMAQAMAEAPRPPAQPAAPPGQPDLLAVLQRTGGGAPPPLSGALDVASLEARMASSAISSSRPSAPPPPPPQQQQPRPMPGGPRPMPGQPPVPPGARPPMPMPPGPPMRGGPPPTPVMPPQLAAQMAQLQAAAAQMPPQIRAAMAQMAHLPPAQQQALLAQIVAHQKHMQQQMAAINQQRPPPPGAGHGAGAPPPPGALPGGLPGMPPGAPPGAPPPPRAQGAEGSARNPQVPHRVGKRMMGSELQLVMRHQALQLQINDPIADDFYHHFWVVKGGQSRAKGLQTRPAVISTERKKMDDEKVGASLGLGAVFHRTPDVAVRTPKKLLEIPTSDAAAAAGETATGGAAVAPPPASELAAADSSAPPLGASRWLFRQLIDKARDTLIELRVHASSAAVMTPQGQQARVELLQRLHAIVRGGSPDAPLNVDLFNHEKGRKLIVDLLPLWPTPVQSAFLLSLVEQLPECLKSAGTAPLADVPALAACLASLPKTLPLDATSKLLEAAVKHGPSVLKQALERSDVTALLLGLLCCPGLAEASPEPLKAFYAALLPLAATSETPWALLNALLPVANAAHAALLQNATAALPKDGMAETCKAAHAAFAQRLQQHLASLG